jgi:putative NADH-flavin reductase
LKIVIYGATGRTGRHLVEQALAYGHAVTVLARDPSRLDAVPDGLTVVTGDVRDAARVAQSVAGAEAVLSVLAPAGNSPKFGVSPGMDNILAAMQTQGVRRLIISVGAGIRDPQDRPTPVHALFGVLVKLLSKHVYADMAQVAARVRASGLDWTIVRAPMLTDGPMTGKIWSGYVGKEMGTRITRADLAAFMLQQLADPTHVRQAPAISNF